MTFFECVPLLWDCPQSTELTRGPVVLDLNRSRFLPDNVPPVHLWSVAQVPVPHELHSSLHDLCGRDAHMQMEKRTINEACPHRPTVTHCLLQLPQTTVTVAVRS